MITEGDVDKYVIVDNRKTVKVYLKKDSIPKYSDQLNKGISGKYSEEARTSHLRSPVRKPFKKIWMNILYGIIPLSRMFHTQ